MKGEKKQFIYKADLKISYQNKHQNVSLYCLFFMKFSVLIKIVLYTPCVSGSSDAPHLTLSLDYVTLTA